ncbi:MULTISPECIES: QueT transporter family protein [Sporosarcina]|uniref:QueT transporter family protein n=1 Tax=Sporosarcina TaxID=1569 RepID=UPI00058EC132|nr:MULTISPECIES: QueT transporter family protein [Sporosarcina]WJY26846.1 QueT transporter family protein [Sporosarcina sp. 0.2-SM1T-5]
MTLLVKERQRIAVGELAKMGIVAGLYVAVTLTLAVISFGAVQLRLSEMFNYLALFHKRYIIAVTAGVVLANFFSPTWFLDVPVGGIATFLVLLISRMATKKLKSIKAKFVWTALIFAVSMFTVAGQLTLLYGMPFWLTWFTVGVGELLSMSVGGAIMLALSKKIDFTR